MISIITGVHNQIGMNRLFCEYLHAHTHHAFQLIVVDNMSSDGSGEFFRQQGADVIRNEENYSYSVIQNQGAALARHDMLVFLNNDVVVSKDWDRIAFELMEEHGLDFAACVGTNRLITKRKTRLHLKRWLIAKRLLLKLGNGHRNLGLMHQLFFLFDFDGFCRRHRQRYRGQLVEGIAGFNLLMTRRGWDLIKPFDERIQAADFDVFLRTKQRALETGDIKPFHLLVEVYLHHFQKITLKSDYVPFVDRSNLIHIAEKWPKDRIRKLMEECDRIYYGPHRSSADFEWSPGDADTTVARRESRPS